MRGRGLKGHFWICWENPSWYFKVKLGWWAYRFEIVYSFLKVLLACLRVVGVEKFVKDPELTALQFDIGSLPLGFLLVKLSYSG